MSDLQKKIKKWIASIEEMTAKLHAEDEATEQEFEAQKAKLIEWIDDFGNKLLKAENLSEEKIDKINQLVADLKSKTQEGKIESIAMVEEQHDQLNESIAKLKGYLATVVDDSKDTALDLSDDAVEKLDAIKDQFNLLKTKAEYLKSQNVEEWEKKKNELLGKLQELKAKIEENGDVAEDRWEEFSKEISIAWNHIKKAIKS